MERNRLQFITNFTDQQRRAVRRALRGALLRGVGTRAAARAFRDAIGLTEAQVAAVNRYRELLLDGSREALSQLLRDRRSDTRVERAAARGVPLGQSEIDRLVARYLERHRQHRAEVIARTEILRTQSLSRHEAMRQTLAQIGMKPGEVWRTWNSTKDERVRDTHAAMDGQTVRGMNTRFNSPSGAKLLYPGDPAAPPEETINCRCVITFKLPRAGA
jgi:hypothetical protein